MNFRTGVNTAMSHFLGIDLGTSSVKVLLVTDAGEVLSQGSAEYPLDRPRPDRAEQGPEHWWQATSAAVRQTLANIAEKSISIAAIGLSGQMHGTVLLDRAGHLLAPAVIWPDQRSRQQVREITDLIGAERLIELTGSPVATGFQAATLRWVQQEQPDLWQQVAMIMLPKDYLRWRMTGEFQTDPSDGSGTLLLDVHHRDWSTELLTALDLDRAKLPPVQPSTAVVGQLQRRAAATLGLPPGIPIVTGAADTAASLLGASIIADQTLLVTISTGGQLILPAMDVRVDPAGRLHTFCAAVTPAVDQPGWYLMAAILSAGLALRWLRDQVLGRPGKLSYPEMMTWAENVPAGSNGLLFLPYLLGERTPHMDPQARGLFLGLSANHGQAEFVRSVLEGVALACYDAYQVLAELGVRPERIVMAGGGARSRLWQQIVADIFGLPVRRLDVSDQSALGAALLAGAGVGQFDPVQAAQDWARYGPPLDPDQQQLAIYQDMLSLFRDAYQKHRTNFHRLQALAGKH
ncbi:MAG TPA: xylulokinase [Anaerolineae bacterium]|jgi:xylulokinase